jgi:hypothetical protein
VISIRNIPSPNDSPLVGPNEFRLVPDRTVNDHFVWTNGKEYLFFVTSSDNHGRQQGEGNWLLGFEAGVDSGYVFLESNDISISPIDILPGKNWKWLQKQQWAPQPKMFMECVSKKGEYLVYLAFVLSSLIFCFVQERVNLQIIPLLSKPIIIIVLNISIQQIINFLKVY